MAVTTFSLFLVTWLKDPGYVLPKQKKLLSLLLEYSQERICLECRSYKPERAKHCFSCGRCVKVYDHHCPWINNCVGANNHAFFFLFLLFLFLFTCFKLTMTITHLDQNTLLFHYNFQFLTDPELQTWHFIVMIVNLFFGIIIILPLFLLLST